MRDIERTVEIGWQAESAERRAKNRQGSAEILAERGVQFETKNMGAHLIVSHEGKVADFWPGTGKYIPRGGGRPGRGVFNLLKLLGVKPLLPASKPAAGHSGAAASPPSSFALPGCLRAPGLAPSLPESHAPEHGGPSGYPYPFGSVSGESAHPSTAARAWSVPPCLGDLAST